MSFRINVDNLQWKSNLSYVISLWERPDIKQKVKRFFRFSNYSKDIEKGEKNWAALTRDVLHEIECLHLPVALAAELRHMVKSIGLNYYNFIKYVTKNLKFTFKWSGKIYWTPYGMVDQKKMFSSIWKNNKNLFEVQPLNWFFVACGCGLLDVVSDHVDILTTTLERYYDPLNFKDLLPNNRRLHLMACTLVYLNHDIDDICVSEMELNLRNKPIQVNLFRKCVLEGFIDGAKFYWNKMSINEREKNIFFAIKSCIRMHFKSSEEGVRRYIANHYIEILAFLFCEIPEEVLFNVVDSDFYYFRALQLFSSIWPWQDHFLTLLGKNNLRFWRSGYFFSYITGAVANNIKTDYDLGYDIHKSMNHRLLRIVWYKIPKWIRTEQDPYDLSDQFRYTLISLLEAFDVRSIKMILNCESFENNGIYIISCFWNKFKEWIEEERYDLLDWYMKRFIPTDDDRRYFKHYMEIFYTELLQQGLLPTTDKLLDWQSSTVEERNDLKNRINVFELCEHFVCKDEFNSADKFLNWYYNSLEVVKAFKTLFGANNYNSMRIIEIWCYQRKDFISVRNREWRYNLSEKEQEFVQRAKKRSLAFLAWILEPEEEVLFKKGLVKIDVVENLFKALCTRRDSMPLPFGVVIHFLQFLSATESEIKKIREYFLGNINYWIKLAIDKNRFYVAEGLVDWLCNDEENKLKIIRNFLKGSDCAVLCDSLTVNDEIFGRDGLVKFLNIWLKPNVNNITEIKHKWNAIAEEKIKNSYEKYLRKLTAEFISKMISAFDKLENGNDINISDLE